MESKAPLKFGRLPRVYERLTRTTKKTALPERPSPRKSLPEQSNPEGPKPKNYGFLASISQSFSRASNISSTRSRNVSDNSSGHATPTKSSRLSLVRFTKKSAESSLATTIEQTHDEEEAQEPDPPVLVAQPRPVAQDPRQVVDAMPPEYWTGRFMALHDHFHGEVFEPANINTIIEAQAARSSFNNEDKAEPIVTNNPSTSIYAPTRLPRLTFNQNGVGRGSMSLNKRPGAGVGRLQHSTTSNAILQTSRLPSNRPKAPSRLTCQDTSLSSPPPLVPGPEDIIDGLNPEELEYIRCETCDIVQGVKQPDEHKWIHDSRLYAIKTRWEIKQEKWAAQRDEIRDLRLQRAEAERQWNEDQQRQKEEIARIEAKQHEERLRQEAERWRQEAMRNLMFAQAAQLVDDESRCKRVLTQLESLCLTDEARRSFHS